jgi:hypothetical protein
MSVPFWLAPAKRWPWFCNCLFGLAGEPALDSIAPSLPIQRAGMHRMTPGLIGFSKVAFGQLRGGRGHACWSDASTSDDASLLLLLIAT